VGCYIWYSEEGTGWGRSPPRPLLAVPNVTAHPSTASVPITVSLYNGPLLCGFNVPIKRVKFVPTTGPWLVLYENKMKSKKLTAAFFNCLDWWRDHSTPARISRRIFVTDVVEPGARDVIASVNHPHKSTNTYFQTIN